MSLLDMKEYFGIFKYRWVLIELYNFASLYKEVNKNQTDPHRCTAKEEIE